MPAPPLPEPLTHELAPQPARRWRARLFQAYLLLALLGFGLLLALATSAAYFPIDLTVTHAVQAISAAWFSTLMQWVSYPGFAPQGYVLSALVCAALFALRLRWEAVCAGLAALAVSGVGLLVKLSVHRPRPTPELVEVFEQLNSYSFPSSHVLFYTTFYGFLFFLIYTLFKASPLRALLLLVLGGLVALVGLSRIELGQHWFSDVVAAYLLGSVCLALTIQVYRWGHGRFFGQPD
jgi:membrane-associated phospholipid phosphatase